MRLSFASMFRLVVVLGVLTFVVAVGRARMEPTAANFRVAAAPAYGVINGYTLASWPSDAMLLDARTGEMRRFATHDGGRLDYASCSPWHDAQGEFQVVGRWTRVGEVGDEDGPHASMGLARYTVPDGRLLDRVALDRVMTCAPCWYPGTSARVLFAAGDGELYEVDFEGGRRDLREPGGAAPRPQAIGWRCPKPGPKLIVKDLAWPVDPRFGGRLIASMQHEDPERALSLAPARLWWLALGEDGREVVDCGPLTDPSSEDRAEERFPGLGVDAMGEPMVGYLVREEKGTSWRLRLAKVEFRPGRGGVAVGLAGGRELPGEVAPAPPSFSTDGRWAFGVVLGPRSGQVTRFPTAPEGEGGPGATASGPARVRGPVAVEAVAAPVQPS